MIKAFVILSLFFIGSFGTASDDLTQALDGLYEQNSLADPTLLPACYNTNETLSGEIESFMSKTLKTASAAKSAQDLINLNQTVIDFIKDLPQSFLNCVVNSNDTSPLLTVFVKPFENKLMSWALLHFLTLIGDLENINKEWVKGEFKKSGSDLSSLGHIIINALIKSSGPSASSNDLFLPSTASDNLTQALDGIFEQNGLPDPKSVIACYNTNQTLSLSIEDFLTTLLKEAASLKLSELSKLGKQISAFIATLPPSFITCVLTNPESQTLAETFLSSLIAKLDGYITSNFTSILKEVQNIDSEWSSAQYKQAGTDGSKLIHEIVSAI